MYSVPALYSHNNAMCDVEQSCCELCPEPLLSNTGLKLSPAESLLKRLEISRHGKVSTRSPANINHQWEVEHEDRASDDKRGV